MKWKDLSLKERKQIYDSVRVNNPGATYFDIKQQFDSIPAYQDGNGTNYKRAYSNIAYKDMTKRGSYVKWGNTDKDGYGQINIKNIKDNVLPTDINDYNIVLDNNIYMPGTANHELGHVADGLAGSRKIQDFDSGMVKNQYDLYRNKNEYIDRLNKLIPMEILMPLGGAGFVGHELNKE